MLLTLLKDQHGKHRPNGTRTPSKRHHEIGHFAAAKRLVKNGVTFVMKNSGHFRASFSEEGGTQGGLKGTNLNLRGQTEPKRRFSLILADFLLLLEDKAFGKHRFAQKTAGTRRKPQIVVRPLRFVPGTAKFHQKFHGIFHGDFRARFQQEKIHGSTSARLAKTTSFGRGQRY